MSGNIMSTSKMFSTLEDIMSKLGDIMVHVGDIMRTLEGIQYIRQISSGDIMSTSGVFRHELNCFYL